MNGTREPGRELPVTDLSLVVLVGASGSGKSTFARRHFKPTEVISSDFCRGLVADDENDQSARLAPFQLLAVQGRSLAALPHDGQLALIDRLVEHDGTGLLQTTRRLYVDTGDPESVRAGVDWWLEMTGRGGEGMVVKPVDALVRTSEGRLVQPGIKCRGREYLRIIYGPEYTRPDNLARLRRRFLNHKRSLALREYALGLEALDRLADGEPLWRVHEAVFGVLALESEPVDPRL
ncbi:AAA family ATPase [Streptomyces canarius]